MYKIILKSRDGFTLAETLISSSVMLFIVLCGWSMYMMGWSWWNEVAPTTECQRIARVALMSVMEGVVDTSAGTDTMNYVTYNRRLGIDWSNRTYADTQNLTFTTPVISEAGRRIDFKLEPDASSSNIRRYYLGQDENGVNVVYYQYGNSTAKIIAGTKGLSDIVFESVPGYNNLLKITVTAEKEVRTIRQEMYHATATYSDYVFLRNI